MLETQTFSEDRRWKRNPHPPSHTCPKLAGFQKGRPLKRRKTRRWVHCRAPRSFRPLPKAVASVSGLGLMERHPTNHMTALTYSLPSFLAASTQ